MRLKEVDTVPAGSTRGRVSQYHPIYERLAKLGTEKWLEISCESEGEFKKLLTSLRAHRTPKLKTRTVGQTVIYAQERR
jgi:hypothetical protein